MPDHNAETARSLALSKLQREMVALVNEGRVRFDDPHPNLSSRIGSQGAAWMIDGREASGPQAPCLNRLVERKVISDPALGETATLNVVEVRPAESGSTTGSVPAISPHSLFLCDSVHHGLTHREWLSTGQADRG